jgi:hypothetical protein
MHLWMANRATHWGKVPQTSKEEVSRKALPQKMVSNCRAKPTCETNHCHIDYMKYKPV